MPLVALDTAVACMCRRMDLQGELARAQRELPGAAAREAATRRRLDQCQALLRQRDEELSDCQVEVAKLVWEINRLQQQRGSSAGSTEEIEVPAAPQQAAGPAAPAGEELAAGVAAAAVVELAEALEGKPGSTVGPHECMVACLSVCLQAIGLPGCDTATNATAQHRNRPRCCCLSTDRI